MPIRSSDAFIGQLVKVLGLPRHTVEFTLHAAVDEPVTVKCVYYPDIETPETVLTERFTLERIEQQEKSKCPCSPRK